MKPQAEVSAAPRDSGRSPFAAGDVEAIARRRGWLPPLDGSNRPTPPGDSPENRAGLIEWMEQAAQLLGARAEGLSALEDLLERVFCYRAAELLARPENQAVLAREGARDVIRGLATGVLAAPAVDSDRFKEIVSALKDATGRRGPELFHPVRLALAGSAGEGDYDRVILLLDGAARLPWAVPVKSCRQRILEFCGALD